MKLSQLRYLCAVHQYGTLSKAAKMLFVSQPTLSVAIRELEKEYGIRLLAREKSGVSFTEAGLTIVAQAEKILLMVDELSSQMHNLANDVFEIRIGFSAAMSKQVVPQLLKPIEDFERAHPRIQVRLMECIYNKQFEALRDGITTMAFGKALKKIEPDLAYAPLLQSEIMLCVGPDHPLAARPSVAYEDFAREDILTFLKEDSKTNVAISEWAREQGGEIHFQYYSQIGVVEELIRMGRGVALLVPSIYIRNPGVVTVPIKNAVSLEYGMFFLKRHRLGREEHLLLQIISDMLNQ